jgi:hypothetical protein
MVLEFLVVRRMGDDTFGGGWAPDDTKAARHAWGVGLVFDAYLACRYRREIGW